MAAHYKVLGQAYPAADTLVDLYTVPTGKEAVQSSLTVCNITATQLQWRLAVRPAAEAIANKHWIIYDQPLDPGETDTFTLGITLAAGDVVSVKVAGFAGIAFSLFGTEIG